MKIYIAAKFDKKEEVRNLQNLFQKKGHKITADWTLHKPIRPYNENPEIAKDYAIEDVDGVKDSDAFILLTDEVDSTDVYVELGVAILSHILLGKPKIFVVGERISRSMFYFHPSVNRRKTIGEVLKEIEE